MLDPRRAPKASTTHVTIMVASTVCKPLKVIAGCVLTTRSTISVPPPADMHADLLTGRLAGGIDDPDPPGGAAHGNSNFQSALWCS